jgi:hypothetical protein
MIHPIEMEKMYYNLLTEENQKFKYQRNYLI